MCWGGKLASVAARFFWGDSSIFSGDPSREGGSEGGKNPGLGRLSREVDWSGKSPYGFRIRSKISISTCEGLFVRRILHT